MNIGLKGVLFFILYTVIFLLVGFNWVSWIAISLTIALLVVLYRLRRRSYLVGEYILQEMQSREPIRNESLVAFAWLMWGIFGIVYLCCERLA